MKYIKIILLFAFIFSCSNESEDSENNSAIIGTWRSVWTCECISSDCELHVGNDDDDAIGCDYDDDCNYWEITFNSNGSGFSGGKENCTDEDIINFEWIVNNNNVIEMTGQWIGGSGTISWPIIILNDNSMEVVIEINEIDGWVAKTFWNKVN